MTMGVSAHDLSPDDLRRELAHLKEKAGDIASTGTPDQQANHRRRTAELEKEFLRRFPPGSDQSAQSSGHSESAAPSAPSGQPVEKASDPSPAGPNDGPINDQPEADASQHRPETNQGPEQPADAPTDDPRRPANPA